MLSNFNAKDNSGEDSASAISKAYNLTAKAKLDSTK